VPLADVLSWLLKEKFGINFLSVSHHWPAFASKKFSRCNAVCIGEEGLSCTVETATPYGFLHMAQHVIHSRKLKTNAMVALISNADEALIQQSTEGSPTLQWIRKVGRGCWPMVVAASGDFSHLL